MILLLRVGSNNLSRILKLKKEKNFPSNGGRKRGSTLPRKRHEASFWVMGMYIP